MTTKKVTKRYIKFLALSPHPSVRKIAIRYAPDQVIKGISNAALNALHGEVPIKSGVKKKQFKSHRSLLSKLASKKVSLRRKRKALIQKGGLAILPLLLSTVIGALGSAFIK